VSKPRVLFVGRTRYRLPLAPGIAQKFDVLAHELDVRVLASALPGSPTEDAMFSLVPPVRPRILDGAFFWLLLPLRIARLLRAFKPDAVICQTAYDAAAALLARRLVRVPSRIVAEVHGDWRTSTRLYGRPGRRALALGADRVAAFALRRVDAVRTVSPFTAGLVRELGLEPAGDFPAFMDLAPFEGPIREIPERPTLLFVGVLEAYKNIDGLAEAWRLASPRVPHARLQIVGKGARAEVAAALVRELGVQWDSDLTSAEVAGALDDAWMLVLPSRSEGMGRIIVESFCRGRGVIGTRAGSIPDLVRHRATGLLVAPDDPAALADAIVEALNDRALVERLGRAAREAAGPWLQTPEEYAQRVRDLVA
jgi:glycosyltransferase involved in cell wall biosynthesis